MTVGDYIKALQELPQDALMVMLNDSDAYQLVGKPEIGMVQKGSLSVRTAVELGVNFDDELFQEIEACIR